MFDGIGEATTRNSSEWAAAGHYICRIDKVKVSETRNSGTGFFIEMTVLHVLQPGPETWDGKPWIEKTHRPGDSITNLISNKFKDMFLPNIKAFVSATMDLRPEAITSANVEDIVEEKGEKAQPLSGYIIEYKGRMTKTKKGNDFTEITYRGTVPATRLQDVLSATIIDNYFDGGRVLEELVKWEADQAGVPVTVAGDYEDPPF